MDRCSERTSRTATRAPRDFHLGSALGSSRTYPTDAGSDIETNQVGFTKRSALWWDAQPNGWRLSCGAELECSQREFYYTGCRTSSEAIEDGRRQLQARVRLPQLSTRR